MKSFNEYITENSWTPSVGQKVSYQQMEGEVTKVNHQAKTATVRYKEGNEMVHSVYDLKLLNEYVTEGHKGSYWIPKVDDWVEVDTSDSPLNGDIGQIEKISGTNHAIVKFIDGTKGTFRIGDLAQSSKPSRHPETGEFSVRGAVK